MDDQARHNERASIIEDAERLDAEAFELVDLSGPGRFQYIPTDDRLLVFALEIIVNHGFFNDVYEDGSCRVGHWVVGIDYMGFVILRYEPEGEDY